MKETASKDNSTSVHSSKPLFAKKGEASFFAQNQEAEQPFFTPSISRKIGGDYHTPHKSFFQAKPQPIIQAKLTINEPGDQYEQEADAMADRVMRMESTPGNSMDEEERTIQTMPLAIYSLQRQEIREAEEPIQTMPIAKQTTLKQISKQSLSALNQTQLTPLFVGIPAGMGPPGGISYIVGRSSRRSLGATGGLTLSKNAAAFTAPAFQTTNRHQRVNGVNQHFATVQPTQSADVTHESFYPGPGDHDRPMSIPQSGTQQYSYYYRITPTLSDLIRQGEQEHLDDLQRAYALTYGLIARVINQMGQREFGPASTPHEADQLAEQELARLLPPALGSHPGNWPIMLDRLLNMTEIRDQRGWHSLSIGPPTTNRNNVIYPLQQEPTFNVGQVSSDQVVNYPRSP